MNAFREGRKSIVQGIMGRSADDDAETMTIFLQNQSKMTESASKMSNKGPKEHLLYQTFDIRSSKGDVSRQLQTDREKDAREKDAREQEASNVNGDPLLRKRWKAQYVLPRNSWACNVLIVLNCIIALWSVTFAAWRICFFDAPSEPGRMTALDSAHIFLCCIYFVSLFFFRFYTSCIYDSGAENAFGRKDAAVELFQMQRVIQWQVRQPSFWMDVLSVTDLPIQCAALGQSGELKRVWMFVEFLRVSHILQLPRALTYTTFVQISRLIVMIFLTAHVITCIWWRIVVLADTSQQHLDEELFNGRKVDEYIYALYLSLLFMTGRGPRALSNSEFHLAAFLGILGALFITVIFGQMNLIIRQNTVLAARHGAKIASIKQALKNMDVEMGLRNRILQYHKYIDSMHNEHATQHLFQHLSGPLALELKLIIYHPLVTRAPFFQKTSAEVIKNIVVSLQDAVYLPGDYIVRKGDYGREMFFIFRGTVEILNADRTPVATLTTGLYFGEVALLTGRRRSAWVQAGTYTVMAVLQKDDLDSIVEDYPEALTALFHRMQQVCNVCASISIEEVREKLLQRFRTVEEAFDHMDVEKKLELNILDFQRGLRRCNIDKTDAKLLFALIDKDGEVVIKLPQFKRAFGLPDEADETQPTTNDGTSKPGSRRPSRSNWSQRPSIAQGRKRPSVMNQPLMSPLNASQGASSGQSSTSQAPLQTSSLEAAPTSDSKAKIPLSSGEGKEGDATLTSPSESSEAKLLADGGSLVAAAGELVSPPSINSPPEINSPSESTGQNPEPEGGPTSGAYSDPDDAGILCTKKSQSELTEPRSAESRRASRESSRRPSKNVEQRSSMTSPLSSTSSVASWQTNQGAMERIEALQSALRNTANTIDYRNEQLEAMYLERCAKLEARMQRRKPEIVSVLNKTGAISLRDAALRLQEIPAFKDLHLVEARSTFP